MNLLADPGGRPFLQPTADRRVRAARARDPLVPRAMHQRRNDVLEHHPVGDPQPMAAQRMRRRDERTLWQQRRELVPERLQQANWQDRHGASAIEMASTSTVAGARACWLLLSSHQPIVGRSKFGLSRKVTTYTLRTL